MRLSLLTLGLFLFILVSCKRETSTLPLSKKFIPMDSYQLVPAKALAAGGNMDMTYNQATRTLTYTVRWNTLSGVPVRIGIYGPASRGFVTASAIQVITSGFTLATQGAYSNTLFVDNVTVKETDLLKGEFYVMVHTAANVTGEIRGQIEF